MKKIATLVIAGLLSATSLLAQIGLPDTVCTGSQAAAISLSQAKQYLWAGGGINIDQPLPNVTTMLSGNGLSVSNDAIIVQDNSQYYGFVTNNSSLELMRLSFGTNPYSTPTVASLGSLGGAITDHPQGIDIVRDGGNWYGFIADGSKLIRVDFGTSLANTPVATSMNFPLHLSYAMQVTVKKLGSNWLAFVGNFTTPNITRFDFGTSLTNTPTATNLPATGLAAPAYFTLASENGNWYMLVTDLLSGNLARLSFSTNLANNAPVLTSLGNPGNAFLSPRGVALIRDCDTALAFVADEAGYFVKLNFGNSITNPPTVTNLGNLGAPSSIQNLTPFWYNNTLNLVTVDFNSTSSLTRLPIFTLGMGSFTVDTSHPPMMFGFANGGPFPIVHVTDMGAKTGSAAWCKDLYVVDTPLVTITASGNVLTASGSYPFYQWYLNGNLIPGATSSTYTTTQSGTYNVQTIVSGCSGWATDFPHINTGIDVVQKEEIHIYPNPSSGVFTIHMNRLAGQKVSVQVYNPIGALVHQIDNPFVINTFNLDLTGHASGLYTIRLSTATGQAVTQVLLQE